MQIPNSYENESTNEVYRPSIDYINAAFKEMGYTPVIKVIPFSIVRSSLQSGESESV